MKIALKALVNIYFNFKYDSLTVGHKSPVGFILLNQLCCCSMKMAFGRSQEAT